MKLYFVCLASTVQGLKKPLQMRDIHTATKDKKKITGVHSFHIKKYDTDVSSRRSQANRLQQEQELVELEPITIMLLLPLPNDKEKSKHRSFPVAQLEGFVKKKAVMKRHIMIQCDEQPK